MAFSLYVLHFKEYVYDQYVMLFLYSYDLLFDMFHVFWSFPIEFYFHNQGPLYEEFLFSNKEGIIFGRRRSLKDFIYLPSTDG